MLAQPSKNVNVNAADRQLKCTRLCAFHLRGECKYGSRCTFAHTSDQLQRMPDLRKTRMCKSFAEGRCNDPECKFAHGQSELRSTGEYYKKALCAWYAKGRCVNGNRCRFAHGAHELRNVDDGIKEQLLCAEAVNVTRMMGIPMKIKPGNSGAPKEAVAPSMPYLSSDVLHEHTYAAPTLLAPYNPPDMVYPELGLATKTLPETHPQAVSGELDTTVTHLMVEEQKKALMQLLLLQQQKSAAGGQQDEGLTAHLASLTTLLLRVSGQLRNLEQQQKELSADVWSRPMRL
jgi:hypothetical protein